jgi:hypothetical protein
MKLNDIHFIFGQKMDTGRFNAYVLNKETFSHLRLFGVAIGQMFVGVFIRVKSVKQGKESDENHTDRD